MIDEGITKKFSRGMSIDRIPYKVYNNFVELAKEDYCNDYGMTLAFLMNFYTGLIPSGIEHLEAEISLLKAEINELKSKVEKTKEEKKRTLLSGEKVE